MVRPTASPGNVSPDPRPAGKVDAPEQQVNLSRGGLHTSPQSQRIQVLPLQTTGRHSEWTGKSSWRWQCGWKRPRAGPLWCWLFYSGHSRAWGKAPRHSCRRKGRGEEVQRINPETKARMVPQVLQGCKPFKTFYALSDLSKGLSASIYADVSISPPQWLHHVYVFILVVLNEQLSYSDPWYQESRRYGNGLRIREWG